MPILRCYVDDRTFGILEAEGRDRDRTPEQLAESAIENAAIEANRERVERFTQGNLPLNGRA